MLDNCDLRERIARYQWFDKTENVHSHLKRTRQREIRNSGN